MAKKTHSKPAAIAYHEPKRVTITKADNGFLVEHHGMNGSKMKVAKTHTEAMKHMKKLMK